MPLIAVGFDLDRTLAVDNKLERVVGLEMAESLAVSRGLAFDRDRARAEFDTAVAASRNAGLPIETALEGVFLELAGPGLENTVETGRFREIVSERAPQYVKPLPGAQEMLDRLEAMGLRYAILTNGWSPFQEEKARLIGFRGPVLVSERIGARKPAPEAFALLARQLDVAPSGLWYVGDDPEVDCAGAHQARATTVWIDWDGRAYPAGIDRPDHTIRALSELPELLQGHLGEAAKARA
jgi:HAD superfamily hydrolase (TIGR01509 family)